MSLAACSSTQKVEQPSVNPVDQNRNVNNKIGALNDASWYTEIDFDKGSAELNQHDNDGLDTLIRNSKNVGSVEEIKIISWADQEYPRQHQKSLSENQKRLADHRSENIKHYLEARYAPLKIHVYNMAERPNSFQQLFETSDAKTKQIIERAEVSFDQQHRMNIAKKESTALVLTIVR